MSNTGAFAELQSEFAKRFFVAANVRFDDNETFGQHTTWRVAPAVILPATETKLKATAGTGFRAPSLNQLYVSFLPFFVSNPDLKPETSFGYDFGFEQPLPAGLSFGVTYFHNDLDNLIAGAPTGDPPPSGCCSRLYDSRQHRQGEDLRHGKFHFMGDDRPLPRAPRPHLHQGD